MKYYEYTVKNCLIKIMKYHENSKISEEMVRH